ncbi:MAG TPA: hypothetical protein ENI62_08530 [Gammaproteobacteria bacterium]|nr:hypothetical protein [Gammaproteobacteria bacterium]
MATRIVTFAGQSVEVAVELDEGRKILDFLFSDLAGDTLHKPCKRLNLTQTPGGSYQITASSSDGAPVTTDSRNEALRLLMDQVIHCLAQTCDSGLLFHAAVVARNGRAVVMPAASGSGKSTLSCWLAKQGFQYCTDELAFLPTDSTRVECLMRPVIIKNAAREMMTEFLGLAEQEQDFYPGPVAMMVPHRLIHLEFPQSCPEVGLLLFPRYQQDTDFQYTELTPAQAGMRLMSVLVNARNLSDHGFAQTARIAQTTRACQIQYSSFAHIETCFSSIFEDGLSKDQVNPCPVDAVGV